MFARNDLKVSAAVYPLSNLKVRKLYDEKPDQAHEPIREYNVRL